MSVAVTAECPVCGGAVDVPDDVIVGELVDCGECATELETRALEPALELREAPQCAEDWGE